MSGFSDKGGFRLYVNEDRIVTTTYEWREDGSFEEEIVLSMAGQNVESTMAITSDEAARWAKIAVESPRGPQTFTRDGTTMTFEFNDKKSTLTIRPGAVLFENYSPAPTPTGDATTMHTARMRAVETMIGPPPPQRPGAPSVIGLIGLDPNCAGARLTGVSRYQPGVGRLPTPNEEWGQSAFSH